jgi:hypothetical protein
VLYPLITPEEPIVRLFAFNVSFEPPLKASVPLTIIAPPAVLSELLLKVKLPYVLAGIVSVPLDAVNNTLEPASTVPNVGGVVAVIVKVALFATSIVPVIVFPLVIVKFVVFVPSPTIILLETPSDHVASFEDVDEALFKM